MRLLIALSDAALLHAVCGCLQDGTWEIDSTADGRDVLARADRCDMLVLHRCLPGMDGYTAGELLWRDPPICPPRILLIAPPEFLKQRPKWADGVLHSGVSSEGIARMTALIAKKPLPALAAAHRVQIASAVDAFLDELALGSTLKGRIYVAWLLERMIPSPMLSQQSISMLYQSCALAHATTAAAVERSLRVAVERVFTQGDLHSIERFFGDAADPERGKLTNRAFLLHASRHLRYSLTAARSPNKSEMHHSPAAPTSV